MELVSFEVTRARLGVHGATLRRWVDEGMLEPATLPDGRVGFEESQVRRLHESLWRTRDSGPPSTYR
jgi:predicted site-specific integrase-resolvase